MLRRTCATLLFVFLGGLCARAEAAPITIYFAGHLDFRHTFLPSLNVNDPFFGSYTFESTTLDTDASANKGVYPPGPAFTVTVGAFTFSRAFPGAPGSITVESNSGGYDTYSAGGVPTAGPAINGLDLLSFLLVFQGPAASAFASDALPTSLSLAPFNVRRGEFLFGMGPNFPYFAFGEVTYLSLTAASPVGETPVPEPASLALLGTGAALLLRHRVQPTRRSGDNR